MRAMHDGLDKNKHPEGERNVMYGTSKVYKCTGGRFQEFT